MVNRFQGPVDEDPSTILSNTNNLLSIIGISTKKVTSMGELVKVASSMFVAVFESLFHVRLEGIIRNPQSRDEYAHNAQRVIDRFLFKSMCCSILNETSNVDDLHDRVPPSQYYFV